MNININEKEYNVEETQIESDVVVKVLVVQDIFVESILN